MPSSTSVTTSSPPPTSSSSSSSAAAAVAAPIFSARGVEWPLPTAFSPSHYRRYRRESKVVGAGLGITCSGLRLRRRHNRDGSGSVPRQGGDGGTSSIIAGGGGPPSAFVSKQHQKQQQQQQHRASSTLTGGGGSSVTGTGGGGGYTGLTGLMGRVLGANAGAQSEQPSSGDADIINEIEEYDINLSTTRMVYPPQPKCVSAANGWIIAVVECSPPPQSTTTAAAAAAAAAAATSTMQQQQQSMSKLDLAALIPPLRLVSRWNVRRGTTTTTATASESLVVLPPPIRPTITPPPIGAHGGREDGIIDPNFGQIKHVFVDPTGCHAILSSKNGEAYYIHSSMKVVTKLNGFGPSCITATTTTTATDNSSSASSNNANTAGSSCYGGYRPGGTVNEALSGVVNGMPSNSVQVGLTPGSYVTAVGWDRDYGTEGSTKRILLGTSMGELYEYMLSATTSVSTVSATHKRTKSGEVNSSMTDTTNIGDPMDCPVLLHRLSNTTTTTNNSSSQARRGGWDGSAVCGILFQRIMVGGSGSVVVMVSTGGLHCRTRLYTFRSELSMTSSLTLRSAFARPSPPLSSAAANRNKGAGAGGGRGRSSRSFIELPGSIDYADLCSCNDDSFALRTQTGIYFGVIERGGVVGSASLGGTTATTTGGIVSAGILTYDSLGSSSGGGNRNRGVIPTSVGLTPHHFITLGSTQNVKFINRVAKKVIQEERVDWLSLSQTSTSESDVQYGRGGSLVRGGVSVGAAELITDIRRPDQIWLRKERSLVHISSSCEDRDVWKYTLAQCIAPTPRHAGGVATTTTNVMISSPGTLLNSDEKHIEGQFENAKHLCSNASQKAVVTAVRAEYHLSQGRVELAAKFMAQCPPILMPFNDTTVRLLLPMIESRSRATVPLLKNSQRANEMLGTSNMALITFLTDKMKAAKSRNDSVACTILGTWLTELHLQEREMREEQIVRTQTRAGQRPPSDVVNKALLHQFLSSFVQDMDPKSIIKILSSHDTNAEEFAGYAATAGDIGAAVDAALCGKDAKNGALDALRVLNDSPIEKAESYYYKHATTLLSRVPMSAAKSFIGRFTDGLSENKLLPAFMHYEEQRKSIGLSTGDSGTNPSFVNDPNASITYFEGVIKLGSSSRAIYNYLTSLYARLEDEGPLFRFLSVSVPAAASVPFGQSVSDILLKQAEEERNCPLDRGYALRTILKTGRHFRSAVKLYMGFGMRQQAVELALKVDPSLARDLARQCDDNGETKRLWLMIARNAAGNGTTARDGKDVVSRVVMVLKECGPDILSIEDVLPFLPDFAQIDQFKDEICEALASYSSKIEHYLKEMNECDQTCDALREELLRLKETGTQVRADARCALTNKRILEHGEPFYAFPSGYAVLESALKREVIPYLNEKQLNRVKFIENELERIRKLGRNPYEIAKYEYEIEELISELGGLIAAECPLTGTVMVESIDSGFSSDDED